MKIMFTKFQKEIRTPCTSGLEAESKCNGLSCLAEETSRQHNAQLWHRVLVMVTIDMMKHYEQKQIGEE